MSSLLEPALEKTLKYDQQQLAETEVPIITVSGSFREDVKNFYNLENNNTTPDVVFSRAHFSMALGAALTAWGGEMRPDKAWLADPTNYVTPDKWRSIQITELIGKTLARQPLLKLLKDFVDRFGRNKLPILESITPPLLYLTEQVHGPILCFHIAAGNILAEHGKTVVQVITDPHVRPEYAKHADKKNIRYCVFDSHTKAEFLEIAAAQNITANPDRVIVTGPPVDPRIVFARKNKTAWRRGPLKLCITTGGLGTNKGEISQILQQLVPLLRNTPAQYQLLVYAGTNADIATMARHIADTEKIAVSSPGDQNAPFRILFHPQIFDANEMLIKYGFPWADGFISKPSGDMAYDAAAAGCFLLTLQPWGVWEERIRAIFEKKEISVRADAPHIIQQLDELRATKSGSSWIERAMNHAHGIEKLFLLGDQKILDVVKKASA